MTNQEDNHSKDDGIIDLRIEDKDNRLVSRDESEERETLKALSSFFDSVTAYINANNKTHEQEIEGGIRSKIINLATLISGFCGVTLILSVAIIGININKSDKENDITEELVKTIPYQVGFLVSGIATLVGANNIRRDGK